MGGQPPQYPGQDQEWPQQQQPWQGPQQPYPGQQATYAAPPQEKPRKKRRVFMWFFFAVQVLFIIWIITAVASVHTGATQAQLTSACYNHNWYPLFKSQADCVQHYGGALNDAGTAGKAIGVGLVVVFWFVVDMILGVCYGVYRLATRGR
jgi:ABC-type phosphate transport system permease subunit